MGMINDSIAEAGEAFMGQGISDGSGIGNVLLWNPSGSGKLLYIDQIIVSGDNNVGADIRFCRNTLGSIFPDHIKNKKIDGQNSVAKIYVASATPPNDYPYNRPIQEVWLGGTNNDRTYKFDPAIIVPQGRGVIVSMAGQSKAFCSFQWREKNDTSPQQAQETISSDMANAENAFDGNGDTYAQDATALTFYIGKIWSASKTITRFVVKSPTNRSFSGANPGRVLTYMLETFDGNAWNATSVTGTYTEQGAGSTQSIIDVNCFQEALGHRIKISESAVASHRVSEVSFYS